MFISDRLIFLELPKTGCSHIIKLLQLVVSGRRRGKHNRPKQRLLQAGRPIVGSIRNPWDWYVSLWAFGCARRGNVRRRMVDAGFGELYRDSRNPELFRRWLYLMHEYPTRNVLGERYGIGTISRHCGFLSYRYAHLFSRNAAPLWDGSLETAADLATFMEGNDTKDHVIRRENLESDVLETLMRIGIHLGSQDRDRIWDHERTNVSNRERDPAYYYDRESVALVSQREQLILRRYSYEPPTP